MVGSTLIESIPSPHVYQDDLFNSLFYCSRLQIIPVMAVLGVQFVITMMMATVLSRVGPHLSIARWLLCSRFAGLVR